jgi:hypothetical protein
MKLDYSNYNILIVDNNSTDSSFCKLKRTFPELIFLKNDKNSGYSGGNNFGIKFALEKGADYIFILNNDTIIKSSEILKSLVSIMEQNEKIGILGPELRSLNSGKLISNYNSSFFWNLINSFLNINNSDIENLNEVSRVSGAAILIRKEVFINIGLFNENFFMYAEENDFCIRSINNGYKIFYYNGEIVYRKTSRNSDQYLEFRNYYDSRNTLYLIKNNFGLYKRNILFIIFILILFKSCFKYIMQGKPKISFSIMKGILHYFLGVKGKKK